MGACCSSPAADSKYEVNNSTAGKQDVSSSKPSGKPGGSAAGSSVKKGAPSVPDFGLGQTHEVIKLLGRGGEGETWLARDKQLNQEVAVKLIKRPIPKPAIAVIKREIKIQADLGMGHMNIVSAREVILTKTHLGLVLEYVPGGNMVGYVTKKRETKQERGGLCLDEEEARYYFIQLLAAVEYCHKNHVAHRDLKLDNTLLDQHNPPWLKLCDFGFAKHWNANSNMDTMRIGTPEYMGPELISSRNGYDGKKVDVWAAGVLLFVMLAGMFPFETSDDNFNNTAGLYDLWLAQIKTTWRDQPNTGSAVSRLTPELRDLLDKVFEVKHDQRLDVAGIKAHPWFKRQLPPPYAESMAELQRQQAIIDQQASGGAYQNADRDKLLEAMLDKAASVALPTEELMRMPLSSNKAPVPAANGAGMSTLKEEE